LRPGARRAVPEGGALMMKFARGRRAKRYLGVLFFGSYAIWPKERTVPGNISMPRSLSASATVFVRTENEDHFRVGTVEDVVDDGYLVSYPDVNNGRRANPEFIAFQNAIDPSVIPPGSARDDTHRTSLPAGAHYVCAQGSEVFRLVRCIENVDLCTADDFLAQPLTVEESGGVRGTKSSPIHISTKCDVYRPEDLSELRRQQYMARVDPLIDVYNTPVFEHWTWRGRARATFPSLTIEGHLVLRLRGHRIKTRFRYPREVAIALRAGLGEGVLEPLEPGKSNKSGVTTWRAERVLFRGGGHSFSAGERGPQFSKGSFLVPILEVLFDSSIEPSVTREVYEGTEFLACTDFILKRMPVPIPPVFRTNDAIRFVVFGRPATIYSPPREERFEGQEKIPRFAVVYAGNLLNELESATLSTFLNYLAGGRLRHVSTERFTPAKRLSYGRTNRGKGTKRLTRPVPLGIFDRQIARAVVAQFSVMLENLRAWFLKDRKGTTSVFHHYAEARNHQYPTTSVVLMSVAIDALVSLVTEDCQSNATVLPLDKFELLEPRLQDALDLAFSEEPKLAGLSAEYERLARKIEQNLNNVSNTKRFERFWADTCGIKLTKDELTLLRMRHMAVHAGYLSGDERDRVTLWANYEKAVRLANLFNRGALAALLRYDGPALDATDGKSYIGIPDGLAYAQTTTSIPRDELRIDFASKVIETDDVDDGDGEGMGE
jgi:hypothetical protein